jgi:hypothetical protein
MEITQAEKEAFEKEYNELVLKHKLILTFQPQWKQSQDTGTWSLVIVPMLAKFEPQK